MPAAFWFMVAVSIAAVFGFISVVVWIQGRTEERELLYRSETAKKIADSGNSDAALEYLRDVERADAAETRGNARIGGLVTIAVGVALMIFLYHLIPGTAVYLVGLIPLLVGVALLIASEFLMKPAD
jgi:hypothetical protein